MVDRKISNVYQCSSSGSNPLSFERSVELVALYWRGQQRSSRNEVERWLMRHTEARPHEQSREEIFDVNLARKATRGLRRAIKKFDLESWLPQRFEALRDSVAQVRVQADEGLEEADKVFGLVRSMLDQFRPFTNELAYTFANDKIDALCARVVEADRATFAFDVRDIDWRDYWLEVQLPGLEKWSIPLLTGGRVPADKPLPLPKNDQSKNNQPKNNQPKNDQRPANGVAPRGISLTSAKTNGAPLNGASTRSEVARPAKETLNHETASKKRRQRADAVKLRDAQFREVK